MSSFVCGRPHWGRRRVTLQLQTSVVSEIKRRKNRQRQVVRISRPVPTLQSPVASLAVTIADDGKYFPPLGHSTSNIYRYVEQAAYLGILCYQNVANTHIARQILFIFLILHFCQIKVHWSEERRAARYTASTKPKTGPRCPQCSRVCASDFGLRSHMRSHDRTGNTQQQCNVIVELDGLQQQQQQQQSTVVGISIKVNGASSRSGQASCTLLLYLFITTQLVGLCTSTEMCTRKYTTLFSPQMWQQKRIQKCIHQITNAHT